MARYVFPHPSSSTQVGSQQKAPRDHVHVLSLSLGNGHRISVHCFDMNTFTIQTMHTPKGII